MHSAPMKLNEHVWCVGNYFYNLYLFRGKDKSALVEVGVSAIVDDAIDHLKELGVSPDYLVVTHPHADHVTGLEGLRQAFPDATVVAMEAAAKFMAHPKAVEALVREELHMHAIMRQKGFSPRRPPVSQPPDCSGAQWVVEGDKISLGGGVELFFLEATGHSPGQIAVHVPKAQTLIASDSLGFRYPGRRYLPMFFANREEYIHTLNRFATLNTEVLGLGHQGAVVGRKNVAEAFSEALAATHQFVEISRANSDNDEALEKKLYKDYYTEELVINSPENIQMCMPLLLRRAREA